MWEKTFLEQRQESGRIRQSGGVANKSGSINWQGRKYQDMGESMEMGKRKCRRTGSRGNGMDEKRVKIKCFVVDN